MKKRILSLLLAVSMTAALTAGCGDSGADKPGAGQQAEEGTKEDQQGADKKDDQANEDVYEMAMEIINFGFDDPDLKAVEDAVNEITVPEIGVKVSFVTVPIFEMSTKLGLMVSGNEKMDLAVTGLLTTPSKLAADGLLQPMTEYLKASPVLMEKAGPLLDACMVDGEIYSYPGSFYPGLIRSICYDAGLAEEYNLDVPEKITSNEELTAFLKTVKESGMSQYPLTLGDGVASEANWMDFDSLGDSSYYSYGVVMDPVNGTKVENIYATKEYMDKCKTHREWYENGYVVPDSISNGYTTMDSLSQGAAFAFATVKGASMSEAYWSTQTSKNIKSIELSQDIIIDASSIYKFCVGIPTTCENPQKVVDFLELTVTNTELANLLNYGIKDQHYVTTEGSGIIDYPEGKDASSNGYGSFVGSYGDLAETYQKAPLTDEFIASIPDYGVEKAVISKFTGYAFNTAKVTAEITAVTAVINQYAPALECGTVDPEKTIPEFLKALEAAGINKIMEENQKQLDAYLAK